MVNLFGHKERSLEEEIHSLRDDNNGTNDGHLLDTMPGAFCSSVTEPLQPPVKPVVTFPLSRRVTSPSHVFGHCSFGGVGGRGWLSTCYQPSAILGLGVSRAEGAHASGLGMDRQTTEWRSELKLHFLQSQYSSLRIKMLL